MGTREKVETLDLDAIRLRLTAYRRRAYLGRSEWTDLVAHAPADLTALLGEVERLEAALREIAVGRTSDDDVGGSVAWSGTMTAARLCDIAKAALSPEVPHV